MLFKNIYCFFFIKYVFLYFFLRRTKKCSKKYIQTALILQFLCNLGKTVGLAYKRFPSFLLPQTTYLSRRLTLGIGKRWIWFTYNSYCFSHGNKLSQEESRRLKGGPTRVSWGTRGGSHVRQVFNTYPIPKHSAISKLLKHKCKSKSKSRRN